MKRLKLNHTADAEDLMQKEINVALKNSIFTESFLREYHQNVLRLTHEALAYRGYV